MIKEKELPKAVVDKPILMRNQRQMKKYSNLITWGLAIFGSLLFWYLLLRLIF